ncbi:MAG: hypothetical protein QM765_33115 [Myxococcales bacterium]
MPDSPKPPAVLLTEGPLAIRDTPLELGPLDLSAWMPPAPDRSAPATSLPSTQSTQSAPSSSSTTSDALLTLAVEVWRLKGRFAKLSETVPAKEKRPLESAVAKMEEALSAAGVATEDPEGRPYHDGDPFEVLLFEPTPALARPTVLQTVKPAVLVAGKVVRRAEVVVGTPGDPKQPGGAT